MKTLLKVAQQNSFVSARITVRQSNRSLAPASQEVSSKNNIQTRTLAKIKISTKHAQPQESVSDFSERKIGTDPTYEPTNRNLQKSQTVEQKIKLAAQKRLIQKLKKIDREVRAHEQAHMAAGGRYVRGVYYKYVRGPDGNSYAVAGEVKIDTSPVPGDPEATLEKARTIKRAALAPSNPSMQDRMVAAQADQMMAKALEEIQKKEMQKILATYAGKNSEKPSSSPEKSLQVDVII